METQVVSLAIGLSKNLANNSRVTNTRKVLIFGYIAESLGCVAREALTTSPTLPNQSRHLGVIYTTVPGLPWRVSP